VIISDKKIAGIVFLQLHKIAQCAEIISQMEVSGRTDATQNNAHSFLFVFEICDKGTKLFPTFALLIKKRMSKPISALGKAGLIERLTSGLTMRQASTVKGAGDDAAVLRYGDTALVVCTDALTEGVHFDLTYTPLQHLGYKAAVSALADVYAMNATPRQLLVSLAVSAKFSVEAMDLLYDGFKHACERYACDLVGGDIAPSLNGLSITVTAIGEARPDDVVYRNTAQVGDLLCVSGDLGAAYLGLQVLEREKKLFASGEVQPILKGYEYVIGRQLRPEARKDVLAWLAENHVKPTAMIDVSAGLSADLLKLCRASQAGCEIHHHKIPIDEATERVAEEFHLEPLVAALNGGDDFELLFTVPVEDYAALVGQPQISIIGYIKPPEDGCFLMSGKSEPIELREMQV
jgi:thiamine-monophosphate kinase